MLILTLIHPLHIWKHTSNGHGNPYSVQRSRLPIEQCCVYFKWAVTALLVSINTSAPLWHLRCNKGKQTEFLREMDLHGDIFQKAVICVSSTVATPDFG